MDRRERGADAQTALLAALAGQQSTIWTAIPCKVTKDLDVDKRTVSCQPSVKSRVQAADGSFSWVQLPLLVDVVVYFPEGGGVTLTFPVKAGDECLVVLASRCIDSWWERGGVQEQPDLRMHDLSDGFAFVGVSSVPRVISDISSSRAQFRSNDGEAYVELDPDTHYIKARTTGRFTVDADDDVLIKSGTQVKIQAPDVVVEADTAAIQATATFTATAPAISYFGNMTWVGYGGGAGSVGMSNMTFNWTNITLAATGGSLSHDGKNIGSTHTHGDVTNGGGNTAAPN